MHGAVRIRKPLVALALALGLVAAGSAQAAKPTLYVNYTLGCTFTITDDTGKTVTAIPAGDYQLLVRTPGSFGGVDLSGTYDMTACKGAVAFQLTGPGVNLASTLDDGDADSDFLYATFAPSSAYIAVDTHQPTVARATFTTTSATLSGSGGTTQTTTGSTPTTTTIHSTPPVAPGTAPLLASVSPTGELTLRLRGHAVSTVPVGRYLVTVADRSTKAGFFIQAGGKPARAVTSAAFKGTKSVRVTLTKGLWLYYAGPGAKKTVFGVS